MVVEKERGQTEKLRYPRSMFFIISNEFCERFSFYGIRAVLSLYLRNQLLYDDVTTIALYHTFLMLVYFFPVFGAMLADSILGKFRTIFYLSVVYALGQILLSIGAVPLLNLPATEFSLVGLLLIAIGTGGIKPCVAAFGGDQFVLPQQERYLSTFFSLFYFSINTGSVISSFLTPLLRSDVACFGERTCYSLAFFVPSVLMVLSIVLFVVGKPLYKIIKPSENVVLNVSKCICHAIGNKVTKGQKREHWLDHADDKYDKTLIDDIKAALRILVLFVPIPIFWALFDQQSSEWTFQANKMDGTFGSFILRPDQMQTINPLLVLILIPLFETCIYPLMAKVGLRTPLRKLTIGGLLAALSFVISALVELKLETTYPVLPSEGFAQLRIYNTLNCSVRMKIDGNEHFDLENLDMYVDRYIKVSNGVRNLDYEADFSKCNATGITYFDGIVKGTIDIPEAKATFWAITQEGVLYNYKDSVDKSKSGDPLVRGLIYVNSSMESVSLKFMKGRDTILQLDINSTSFNQTRLAEIDPDTYDIYLDDTKLKGGVDLKVGGVYTVLGSVIGDKKDIKVLTITEPNSLSILWLIPQYVVITMGEVMFSVTGLEFAFTQAPSSMKSLLQASWLLTVAIGNLIVAVVAKVSNFDRMFYQLLFFAGLMFLDMILFAIIAKFYKYVEEPDTASITEEIHMDGKNGTINESYKDDEK